MVINGWSLHFHPLFLDELEELVRKVESQKAKDETAYKNKNAAKVLFAIIKLFSEAIPQDPSDSKFRQGKTLGKENKHWFRAKFYQQYRLFFRFDDNSKVIVFVWVNNTGSLRAYGSKTDAYKVFKTMLDKGNPPGTLAKLIQASIKETVRYATLAKRLHNL